VEERTKSMSNKTKAGKPRKTRLLGTATHRPCVDCKQDKDRFKDFKPRWAGCADHRTEAGRRYHQPGCVACDKVVNGNIRQPRCIECDSKRQKKGRKAKVKADPTPTPTPPPIVEPQVVSEPVIVSPQTEPSPESVEVPDPAPQPAAPARPAIATVADLAKLFDDDVE
jgi:hypothetical protein